MSRSSLGLALLILVVGSCDAGATESACTLARLAAARSYVDCLVRHERRAIRHATEPDLERCDARAARALARDDCALVEDAASLGRRLRAALAFEPAPPIADEARLTPVLMAVVAPPQPVTGSDGMTHLVYEVALNNASALEWPIEAIEVLDGGDPARVLLTIEGDEVLAKTDLLAGRTATRALGPGQSGVVYLHLVLEPDAPVPDHLVHRLTLGVPDGLPEAARILAGLPPGATVVEQQGARSTVADRAPVALGPPLRGDRWLAADGCCVAPHHVRALRSINGELLGAQRFAIDWERLDEDHRIYVGDRSALESYVAYGEPVLAVADARVARVVDGMAQVVPGELPLIALADADGNHVILDLGDGRFVLYAHLMPGSIRVAEGDRVRRGEVLAQIGNSGNTLAPHLHLHVMSAPSGLAADGLPYVFDGYELLGRAASTEAFEEAEANGSPLAVVPADIPGAHAADLPLDQSIVRFAEP